MPQEKLDVELSDVFLDLVKNMLMVEEKARYSIEKVKVHPFVSLSLDSYEELFKKRRTEILMKKVKQRVKDLYEISYVEQKIRVQLGKKIKDMVVNANLRIKQEEEDTKLRIKEEKEAAIRYKTNGVFFTFIMIGSSLFVGLCCILIVTVPSLKDIIMTPASYIVIGSLFLLNLIVYTILVIKKVTMRKKL